MSHICEVRGCKNQRAAAGKQKTEIQFIVEFVQNIIMKDKKN
jgi:hypothetical protein